MCTGSRPSSCAATAMPASVCMCQTHCASSRAMWMALWMTKPALLALYSLFPTRLPSASIFTRDDAVTSSKRRPYGLMRKWCSGPGTRALMWVYMSSDHPRWSAIRYAPASCTRNAHSAGEMEDAGARTALIGGLSGGFQRDLAGAAAAVPGIGHVEQELLHVPGAGGAAFGAQATVQADVLVFHHHPGGFQLAGNVEVLREVLRRSVEPRTQVLLVAVLREGDAVHRADVDAGIALDAQLVGEHRLHVAVQAALRFLPCGGDVEAELDFHLHVLQRRLDVGPGHFVAGVDRDVVVVAPLVDAHLLRNQGHPRRGAFRRVFLVEELVDGDRGVVTVRDRPDDVLRAERRVAAEEDVRNGRLERDLVEHRQSPLVELDARVALDPGEGVLLANGDQDVVALEGLVGLAGGHEAAPALVVV